MRPRGWPVSAEALRPRVPVELQVQEFQGTAWVSVTPFWMSDVSVRNLPAVPGISTFPELNVRTYVNRDDRPGVWFFSLDADNFLAVRAARAVYHLPYMDAQMSVSQKDDGIHYVSQRSSGRVGASGLPPGFFIGGFQRQTRLASARTR